MPSATSPRNNRQENNSNNNTTAATETEVRPALPAVAEQLIPSSHHTIDTDVTKLSLPTSSSSSSSSSSSLPFDSLRSDFNSVLSELWQDRSESSLERFRAEYDNLLSIIRKHQDNEKRLINKCHELNNEIVNNAAKIQTAIRLSLQDQANLTAVKAEVDKAWKLVDISAEKEKKQKELIHQLKTELIQLQQNVQEKIGASVVQQEEKQLFIKEITLLQLQLTEKGQQLNDSTNTIQQLNTTIQSLDVNSQKKDKEILLLKEKYASQKAETQRTFRKSERLQSECMTLKETIEKKQQAWNEKEKEFVEMTHKKEELQAELIAIHNQLHSYQQDVMELRIKLEEMEKLHFCYKNKELEAEQIQQDFAAQLKKMARENKQKEQECNHLVKKIAQMEKEKLQIYLQKSEAEKYRQWLKEEMKNVLKNMDVMKQQAEADTVTIHELQLTVKKLQLALINSAEKNNINATQTTQHLAMKKSLENDLYIQKNIEQELRQVIYNLEKEKERECLKANQWYQKYHENEEWLKMKNLEIHDLSKNLAEEQKKLKIQQSLYEQVRHDRNLFSRQQISNEDEINEMRRKFKIMVHQIEQLKEEIATKDAALINEHFVLKRNLEENKILKRKLNKRKEVMMKCDMILSHQNNEIKKMRKILNTANMMQSIQQRQYQDVITERDMIGSQLIRRNDELALLYEKLRIQNSVLNKGEIQYRDRIQECITQQHEVKELTRRLSIKMEEGRGVEMMRVEIRNLTRELMTEKNKTKALSEELENPMNVHRWRKLEGSDPSRFELLIKIQTLQKRLIYQTELTVEAQHLHSEKEVLYQQAKMMLSRVPGPELNELLSKYERADRAKTKQMRAMCAELNMMNATVGKLQWEMEKLEAEKQEWKKKAEKESRESRGGRGTAGKEEGERKENDLTSTGNTVKVAEQLLQQQQERFFASQPRITGGGFHLQTQVHAQQ